MNGFSKKKLKFTDGFKAGISARTKQLDIKRKQNALRTGKIPLFAPTIRIFFFLFRLFFYTFTHHKNQQ